MTDLIETTEQHEASRREAQLVAATIHGGGVSLFRKTCWQCGDIFATPNKDFNLCSDWCLSDYLYDRGINWDPEADPEDRWPNGQSDAILGTDTIRVLQAWARKILKLKLDP